MAVLNDHTQGPLRAETANKATEALVGTVVPALSKVRVVCSAGMRGSMLRPSYPLPPLLIPLCSLSRQMKCERLVLYNTWAYREEGINKSGDLGTDPHHLMIIQMAGPNCSNTKNHLNNSSVPHKPARRVTHNSTLHRRLLCHDCCTGGGLSGLCKGKQQITTITHTHTHTHTHTFFVKPPCDSPPGGGGRLTGHAARHSWRVRVCAG